MRAAVPVSVRPFSSERARTPCTIGKMPPFFKSSASPSDLEVKRLLKKPIGVGKRLDRACETRQLHPLAAQRFDQILLGGMQQLGVAGQRLRVVEDRDVHHAGFIRQRQPATEIVAKIGKRL